MNNKNGTRGENAALENQRNRDFLTELLFRLVVVIVVLLFNQDKLYLFFFRFSS